ncbi:MAG TPA: 4a-hydroxytetrahydrobiopterin dehydratase [Acidobacteriaceae bacterium]|nr:4a-hydroxytetrahydrobiopterin dehydratase [Acidobacteriaceae bacterium]
MAVLSADETQEKLKFLPGWKLVNGEIVRETTFKDFVAAVSFVNQVAAKAEAAGHHPDIDIRYNKVRLALVSHDAGGLTPQDFDMAASIESLLADNARA